MTTVDEVLRVARASLGYEESPKGSNHNKFGAWYGINPAPWCAIFVSYCFYAAGHPLAISTRKGFSYCPSGVAYAKANGLWSTHPPYAPGDVIFFDWDGSRVDHTGIVLSDDGIMVTTIEGNTGDLSDANGGAVMIRHRAHNSTIAGVMKTSRLLSGKPSVPHPHPHMPAPAWPGRVLGLTSPLLHGSDVVTWQTQMRKRGWKIQADGVYGPASEHICRQFQAEKHIAVDGHVGPATWRASWVAAL